MQISVLMLSGPRSLSWPLAGSKDLGISACFSFLFTHITIDHTTADIAAHKPRPAFTSFPGLLSEMNPVCRNVPCFLFKGMWERNGSLGRLWVEMPSPWPELKHFVLNGSPFNLLSSWVKGKQVLGWWRVEVQCPLLNEQGVKALALQRIPSESWADAPWRAGEDRNLRS